jgi:hypothetical protein
MNKNRSTNATNIFGALLTFKHKRNKDAIGSHAELIPSAKHENASKKIIFHGKMIHSHNHQCRH